MRSLSFSWETGGVGTSAIVAAKPDLSPEMVARDGETCFWVVDSRVSLLWKELFSEQVSDPSLLLEIGADESAKTLAGLEKVLHRLHSANANRDWRMVAAGGGITMDMAAMAASLYRRGMNLTLVPTTLLGMVDACLGGKTGVNLHGAKNQLGTVYPAQRVAVFTGFLSTLSKREFRNGSAEALKTAVIADREIADILLRGDPGELPELVERCLRAKAGVIGNDLADRGRRRLLNLGHTLGHAIESQSQFSLSHGEAVALGMVGAAWMAGRRGSENRMDIAIAEALQRLGLPTRLPSPLTADRVMGFLRRDKKTSADGRSWVLPMDWEDCRVEKISPGLELGLVEGALEAISP